MTVPTTTNKPPVAVQQWAAEPGRKRGSKTRNGTTPTNPHRQSAAFAKACQAAPASASQIKANKAWCAQRHRRVFTHPSQMLVPNAEVPA